MTILAIFHEDQIHGWKVLWCFVLIKFHRKSQNLRNSRNIIRAKICRPGVIFRSLFCDHMVADHICDHCLSRDLQEHGKIFHLMADIFINLTHVTPEVFCKKVVLKIVAKFTGKRLYRSLFLNKEPATFFKKRLRHRCFLVFFKITNFYRTPLVTAFHVCYLTSEFISDCLDCVLTVPYLRNYFFLLHLLNNV